MLKIIVPVFHLPLPKKTRPVSTRLLLQAAAGGAISLVSNSPFESASHTCSPRGTILKYPSDAFYGSIDKWKPNCFSESSKALEPGSSLA